MAKKKDRIWPGRDGIWMLIRHYKSFTKKQITNESQMHESTVSNYLKQLVKMGYLRSEKSTKASQAIVFHLIKDSGQHRPDLNVKKPNGQQKIWMALKPLKRFTCKDVSLICSTPNDSTNTYLLKLCAAGYLKVVVSVNAVKGKPNTYVLDAQKDKGPRAPQIKKNKFVYDPNINEVVWPLEGEVK